MSVVESSTQSMLGVHGWIHHIMVIATALLLKKYVEIHGFHMTTETSKSTVYGEWLHVKFLFVLTCK